MGENLSEHRELEFLPDDPDEESCNDQEWNSTFDRKCLKHLKVTRNILKHKQFQKQQCLTFQCYGSSDGRKSKCI